MIDIISQGVKIGFYKESFDFRFKSEMHCYEGRIKPLSRFSFAEQAGMSLLNLIRSIFIATIEISASLYVLFTERRINAEKVYRILSLPVVSAAMIPLSIVGIIFPKTINEKVLGLVSKGFFYTWESILSEDPMGSVKKSGKPHFFYEEGKLHLKMVGSDPTHVSIQTEGPFN